MKFDITETQLIVSPLKNLQGEAIRLKETIPFGRRWTNFSLVFGISETEIKDFIKLYVGVKEEMKNTIAVTENLKLKEKFLNEFQHLPTLYEKEFISKNFLILNPIKKISRSIKFKRILNEIIELSKRMTDYIENAEWLELEHQ